MFVIYDSGKVFVEIGSILESSTDLLQLDANILDVFDILVCHTMPPHQP